MTEAEALDKIARIWGEMTSMKDSESTLLKAARMVAVLEQVGRTVEPWATVGEWMARGVLPRHMHESWHDGHWMTITDALAARKMWEEQHSLT